MERALAVQAVALAAALAACAVQQPVPLSGAQQLVANRLRRPYCLNCSLSIAISCDCVSAQHVQKQARRGAAEPLGAVTCPAAPPSIYQHAL